jgi:hypothetical protein
MPTPYRAPAVAMRRATALLATIQVIAAAGDIACDPGSPSFQRLRGAADACHMRATANLLTKLDPVVVLTLGDNQYENGTLAKYQRSYDPTCGRLKDRPGPPATTSTGPEGPPATSTISAPRPVADRPGGTASTSARGS